VGGGEKRKEKIKKNKKREGNGNRGRERGKKLRKEGILGVVKKIKYIKK
jgi:hypothetical protein